VLAATQAQLYAYAADVRRTVSLERARRRELEQAYLDTVAVLAGAVEARDPYTAGHGARVAGYAVALAGVLGCSQTEIEEARLGGLLHDLGKLGVDDAILRKPGYLEEAEWQQMRRHPEVGAGILRRAPFLVRAAVYATATTSGGTASATRSGWREWLSPSGDGSWRWLTPLTR